MVMLTRPLMSRLAVILLASALSIECLAQNPFEVTSVARTSWRIAAGASVPVGTFSETSNGGAARPGAALSAEIATGGPTSWVTGVLVSYNPTMAGARFSTPLPSTTIHPWWTIWPMTGLEWRVSATPSLTLDIGGQVGLFLGFSPGFSFQSAGSTDLSIPPDHALAVSAGGSAGATFNRYALRIRYVYADPRYGKTVTAVGTSYRQLDYQATSLLVLALGWTW